MIEERHRGRVTELLEDSFVMRLHNEAILEVLYRRLDTPDLARLLEAGPGCVLDMVIRRPDDDDHGVALFEFPEARWSEAKLAAVRREAEALAYFFEGDPAGAPTVLTQPCARP